MTPTEIFRKAREAFSRGETLRIPTRTPRNLQASIMRAARLRNYDYGVSVDGRAVVVSPRRARKR